MMIMIRIQFLFSPSLLLVLLLLVSSAFAVTAFVVPTGQFAPQRSEAWVSYMEHLISVSAAHGKLLTACVSSGTNDEAASDLADFLYEWERMTFFRETSTDYQLQEFCCESYHLNKQIQTMSDTLVPFCRKLSRKLDNCKGIDRTTDIPDELCEIYKLDEQLLELQQLTMDTSLDQFPNKLEAIEVQPFTPIAFLSQPTKVQEEVKELLDLHKDVIAKGSNYGCLDEPHQLQYMRSIRTIEEKWEIVLTRFTLIGGMNPLYEKQCQERLSDLGLNEDQYKEIHSKSLGTTVLQTATTPSVQLWQPKSTPDNVDELLFDNLQGYSESSENNAFQ